MTTQYKCVVPRTDGYTTNTTFELPDSEVPAEHAQHDEVVALLAGFDNGVSGGEVLGFIVGKTTLSPDSYSDFMDTFRNARSSSL